MQSSERATLEGSSMERTSKNSAPMERNPFAVSRKKGLKSLKRHALTRLLGMAMCTGTGVAFLYYELQQPLWAWLIWGYSVLIHTPLWYFICRKSKDILRAEQRVMIFDFFIFGHFMAMVHFQPWVVFALCMVTTVNTLTGAGVRMVLTSVPSILAGALLTVLVNGMYFQAESSLVIMVLCIIGVTFYTGYTAFVAGKSMRDLRTSRHQIQEQASALKMSNECLEQSIQDLKQTSFALAQSEQERIAAEVREKTKAAFLANMSHELRTPMNGVMGMLCLLKGTELDDEQQNYVVTADNSANTLLLLLDDILDYAKLETSNIGLDVDVFEIEELVEEVLQIYGEESLAKNVDLVYWHDYGIHYALKGDPNRLKQVFTNLIGNAIKYTPKGHIIIRSRIVGEDPESYRIRFEVEDTGIGIPGNKQNQVFDAFYQVDQSNTRSYSGAGLGLALCRQILRHMDGIIGVESEDGRGSTFWFEVPLEKNPERIYQIKPNFDGILLVVDPNVISRDNLRHRAKALSCDVIAVSKWQEAEALLEREHNDVILLVDVDITTNDDFRLWRTAGGRTELSWALMGCASTRYGLPGWLKGMSPQFIGKPIRQKELAQYLVMQKPMKVQVTGIAAGKIDENFKPIQDLSQLLPRDLLNNGRLGPSFGHGMQVLVVEDNKVNQRVAVARLQKMGFLVDVADHGEQALNMVTTCHYDLVFMDCQMPVMDGFEATRRIRALEKNGRITSAPIIAMTAHVMNEDKAKCFDAGMNDFLRKPVTQDHLEKTMKKWLAQKSVEETKLDV
ncbi:response regulator [Litoribrevibacter euphylliae]|uniref:histidine kinase n=1 Tax=Litoribrevibacter euphylliae TaxID=1834034 RepID=A0ABV7HHY1_9GAMM